MISDAALRRYSAGQFTDDDVVRSTGLSVRSWRELIKLRAVRTVTENLGRGNVRICDQTVLKRGAVIGALNRAGFSLAVSGHIAYALPFHTLVYEICDPCAILLDRSQGVNSQTGLPPRLKEPKADWFQQDKIAAADVTSDWLLAIYEHRFVAAIYSANDEPTIFGDLREDGTQFVSWFPYRRRVRRLGRVIEEFVLPSNLAAAAEWENPTAWSKDLKNLGYEFEKHDEDDDTLCTAAQACRLGSLFTTTINVTLTIRKALRRYLDMEPAPGFDVYEPRRKIPHLRTKKIRE
jgi:hypothetical protein